MPALVSRQLAIICCLVAGSVESAELLGHISDETAGAETAQADADFVGQSPISYRVICPPDTKMLPECQLPTVQDSLSLGEQAPASEPVEQAAGSNVDKPRIKHKSRH
ncbi:hypothetical protein KEF85_02070 [Methylomonas paludis]|uniref:Uncharacterized protein n=1 Tax=Methylomonas paludis TaxID=1173101 RepID=A0A975MNZ0_9GAMM|nr:hypothetical protein [Methylomonas paludis]QWF71302.1 hypothetical protein KEF85_02070 [Methylomonas paludis]